MKRIISLMLLLMAMNSYGQDAETNLKKYWKFRERLKNFVVPGNCLGCGNAAQSIGYDGGECEIKYDDSGIRLGMYVSMLAMEYKLLANNSQDLSAVRKELYYAIEALNRVDKYAEAFWTPGLTPQQRMDLDPTTLYNPGDLNGFFIRDDVKDAGHFLNGTYDNKRIIDHLTSSFIPLPSKFIPRKTDSGFTAGVWDGSDGPREESLDQVVDIYMGLALVKTLVPSNDNYIGTQFSDGEVNFVQEVKNISCRINTWMAAAGWTIHNPQHAGCVYGVCGNNDITNTLCLPGACGGGDVTLLAEGFNEVNDFIQGSGCSSSSTNASQILWNTAYRWDVGVTYGDEDKILTLAAIFNPWGDATNNNIADRGWQYLREFVDLLHNVLHGEGQILSNEYYECLLNACTCDAPMTGYEWGVVDRFVYGPNTQYYGGEPTYLLDYLIYFGLYSLSNTNYQNNFHYIEPKKLAEYDRYLQNVNTLPLPEGIGYNEITERNYLAENSIRAGNNVDPNASNTGDYVIDNFGDVKMVAGNYISLEPGFSIINGGLLNAYIDQTIEDINCTPPQYTTCSNFCDWDGDEEQQGYGYSTNNVKVFKVVPNELFVSSGKFLFKIREDGGTGQNMFALQTTGGQVNGLPGYNYYIGHQEFDAVVVDVKYIDNNTFVFLANGDVLKVQGTGGTGIIDMFGATENGGGSSNAFTPSAWPFPQTYMGDARFNNGITNVEYVAPYILIAFNNGLILKATTGGTGHNMFNIDQNNNDIWDNSGYNQYYSGDIKFCSAITEMKYFASDNILFVGCADGWTAKINGTGGTGDNMFALDIDCSMFGHNVDPLGGYNYWNGDERFNYPVYYAEKLNGNLYLSFSNGHMTSYYGLGGTGNTWSGGYLRGEDVFSEYATGMIYSAPNNCSVFSFADGRLLKVEGTGGTGAEMFNVDEGGRGFYVYDWNYYAYFKGCMFFEQTAITCMTEIDGKMYIGLDNGTLMKLAGYGGTGLDMYAITNDNGVMKNLCLNHYLIGEQDFHDVDALRTSDHEINDELTRIDSEQLDVFPNPNKGMFNLLIPGGSSGTSLKASFSDITGRVIKEMNLVSDENTRLVPVDLTMFSNGIYFVEITDAVDSWKSKIYITK